MSKDISEARNVMAKAFKEDPHSRFGYRSNIAMYIWDRKREGYTFNRDQCNEVANDLIKLIFES